MAQAIYDFTWNEYCDWYLELSKPILNNTKGTYTVNEQNATRHTLTNILEELLRVMHPIMPYITEAIWQKIMPAQSPSKDQTIMLAEYPAYHEEQIDTDSESEIAWLQLFILGIRNIRGEMNISPGKLLPIQLYNTNPEELARVTQNEALLKAIAKIESITLLHPADPRPPSSTALVGTMEIWIPIAGLIDLKTEVTRLQKEIDKYTKDWILTDTKLKNPNFVQKAPGALVATEQQRLMELSDAIQQLKARQKEITVTL